MSERDAYHRLGPRENGNLRNDEGGLRAPPGLGPLGKAWWWFHFVILVKLARLRFIAVLVAIGGVIAYWDTLNAYYEKWTRPLFGQETAVSSDTEYWCPMHPTIVRDHPDKCPICAMPLSKRKKGDKDEGEALPPGVTQRVQITPYKVAVAGIETAEIGYRPLTKEIAAVGFVEFDERKQARISARVTGKTRIDKLYVNVTGQHVRKGEPLAELYSPDLVVTVQNLLDARQANNRSLEKMARDRLRLWGVEDDQIDTILKTGQPITHVIIRSPIHGHIIKKYQVEGEYVEEGARLYDVADLSTVWIEAQVYEDQVAFLKEGLPVTATTKAFPNREFAGKVAFIQRFLDTATRTVKVRFDMRNPGNELLRGMYATVTLEIPAVQLNPLPKDASEEQKRMYERDLVLAVPERAVIDTGSRKIVYRESEQDTFEGVDVQLGPRCGAFYPVLGGLQVGDRVATAGSFLIDAETRLTAGASSTYFGASAGPQGSDRHSATTARPSMTRDEEDKVQAVLAKLSPEDRSVVALQGFCPILTDNRLGSMGKPVKVLVKGQPVFLCCKGCVNKALANPAKTLANVEDAKARTKPGTVVSARPPTAPDGGATKAATIKAMLIKLSPDDRRLAVEQGYCPETERPLGSMGVPVKITLNAQPVFLGCPSCEDEAREHANETLSKVKELKAKATAPSHQKWPLRGFVGGGGGRAGGEVSGRADASGWLLPSAPRHEPRRNVPMKAHYWIGLLTFSVPLLLAGCTGGTGQQKAASERQYDIKGTVVAVAQDKPAVTLDHEDIPGLMKGMKMEFRVDNPKLLESLKPGDTVQGRLKVESGNYTITRLEKR